MKHTAVEFLAEKYNYITWLRNRDEISAGTADEWRAKYLEQAKQMEQGQIIEAHNHGFGEGVCFGSTTIYKYMKAEEYYNETYGNEL
jgi:hypothetical protein